MDQEVNIDVVKTTLLNAKNIIHVEVILESIWDKVIKYRFIYVTITVNIPVIENEKEVEIVYPLQQEYAVSSINPETKSVQIIGEFLGKVNMGKEITGTSKVIGYQKITEGEV